VEKDKRCIQMNTKNGMQVTTLEPCKYAANVMLQQDIVKKMELLMMMGIRTASHALKFMAYGRKINGRKMNQLDRILTIREAAEMLGTCEKAVHNLIRRGVIKEANPGEKPKHLRLSEVVNRIDTKYSIDDPSQPGTPVDPNSPLARLFTYKEAADYMGITIETLANRISHGKRPRPTDMGHGKMIRLADIVEAMDTPSRVVYNPEKNRAYKLNASRPDESYRIRYETIMAQCPTCGDKRKETVVKGSSKWIYCHRHVGNRYGLPADNKLNFSEMRPY